MWKLFFAAIFLFVIFIVSVRYGLFGQLPDYKELENPKTNLATQILSSDGVQLGTYFKENRTTCAYSEISQHVIDALIATEDERFYEHPGIDLRGLTRAIAFMGTKGGASTITQQLAKLLFTDVRASSFLHRLTQKFKEWIIAVQLERHYTKQEILTMYLNKFDWVNHAVGIKSAAAIYFAEKPDQLEIQQAAMLVGMLKNPALFNPLRRAELTKERRNTVLGQMKRNNLLTGGQVDSLSSLDLGLDFHSVDHKSGTATYFREILRAELTDIFSEQKNGEYIYTKADGSKYNIYKDGLKVYTTIDARMQKHAEAAVSRHLKEYLQPAFFKELKKRKNAPFMWDLPKEQREKILNLAIRKSDRYRVLVGKQCGNCGRGHKFIETITEKGSTFFKCKADDCGVSTEKKSKEAINKIFNTKVKMKVFSYDGDIDTLFSPLDSIKYYKSFLHTGFMAMHPRSGHIKAWVGGIDYKNFSYDHVKQGRRQVGSTFKPFVYSFAMQNGYNPCTKFPNVRECFEIPDQEPWCPPNADGKYGGEVTLKKALANSLNTITAKLMKQFTPGAIVQFAKKLGIKAPLDPVPSLCLGVADISVYEMVGANATFANKGVYTQPIFINYIEDKNGNIIYEKHPDRVQAMDEESAYTTIALMKGVTQGGSGTRLRLNRPYGNIPYPIAGKTGTTNNHSDGWFIGITPDLVAGCWVGADDRAVHFSRLNMGQGATMALPIWGYFMNSVYKDEQLSISKGDFARPESISQTFDCTEFEEQSEDQDQFNEEFFEEDDE